MNRQPVATPSLLPFMLAGVLVLLALNMVHLVWEWWGSNTVNMPLVGHTRAAPATLAPKLVDAPVFSHNLQFGDAGAAATLTIFTDPACAPCRAKVTGVLGKLPASTRGSSVRVIYKFWPQKSDNPTGGLITEIARREGLATPFMQALDRQPSVQGDDLLAALESAGLPLAKQQDWLKNHVGDLVTTINEDIAQGENLNLGPAPQFILNNYLMEPDTLPVDQIATYVTRINAGEQILQSNDYWLNP